VTDKATRRRVTREYEVVCGDAIDVLKTIPDNAVHACVTSPPFFRMRDYRSPSRVWGTWTGALGLEPSPALYIEHLVEVCREIRRVLRHDGSFWLNLGDTFSSRKSEGLRPKNLIGVPWRVALALQADGWWLRCDAILSKRNLLPEAATDRPTRSHEYLFLLTKSPTYFYDRVAVAEPLAKSNAQRTTVRYNTRERYGADNGGNSGLDRLAARMRAGEHSTRNRRSVWSITTRPYKGAHFAVMSESAVEPCVLAGTSARGVCPSCGAPWARVVERDQPHRAVEVGKNRRDGGLTAEHGMDRTGLSHMKYNEWLAAHPVRTTGWRPTCSCRASEPVPALVLDPFCGSGTTGVVALKHGRSFLGIDVSETYCEMARGRIAESIVEMRDDRETNVRAQSAAGR